MYSGCCRDTDAWVKVLGKHEYKNLKLCLTHFSGFDFWIKDRGEFDWREKLSKLISENENLYTDMSCFINLRDSLPNQLTQQELDNITDPGDLRILEEGYKKQTDLLDRGFIAIQD